MGTAGGSVNADRLDVLLGLVVALVTILTYIAWLIRKIRKMLRAWEQHQEEHQLLLEVGHWHDHGRVIPLIPSAAPRRPQHRRQGAPW
jgi:hypothetical protein